MAKKKSLPRLLALFFNSTWCFITLISATMRSRRDYLLRSLIGEDSTVIRSGLVSPTAVLS